MYIPKHDDDDDTMTEEEYAALEASLTADGFIKDGKLDLEALRSIPTAPLDEFEEMLNAHYSETEAQEETETK